MIQQIENICNVEYSSIDEIQSIDLPLGGPAVVSTTWHELPCAPGSILTISERNPDPGRQFTSEFRATLRTSIINKDLLIIRITLTSGSQLLFGDLDLPVRILEDHTLQGKDISFSHTSWHYPYVVQDVTGSGSAGSGL